MGIARLHSGPPGLSTRPAAVRALCAFLYLVAALTVAWHAPHVPQGRAAVGVDHHRHHEAAFGDECALCSVKTAPQQTSAGTLHGIPAGTVFASIAFRAPLPETVRRFSARPRGPPAVLS